MFRKQHRLEEGVCVCVCGLEFVEVCWEGGDGLLREGGSWFEIIQTTWRRGEHKGRENLHLMHLSPR